MARRPLSVWVVLAVVGICTYVSVLALKHWQPLDAALSWLLGWLVFVSLLVGFVSIVGLISVLAESDKQSPIHRVARWIGDHTDAEDAGGNGPWLDD